MVEKPFIKPFAFLLTVWYLICVVGLDVHTCSAMNRSFVTVLSEGVSCSDVHPDVDGCCEMCGEHPDYECSAEKIHHGTRCGHGYVDGCENCCRHGHVDGCVDGCEKCCGHGRGTCCDIDECSGDGSHENVSLTACHDCCDNDLFVLELTGVSFKDSEHHDHNHNCFCFCGHCPCFPIHELNELWNATSDCSSSKVSHLHSDFHTIIPDFCKEYSVWRI